MKSYKKRNNRKSRGKKGGSSLNYSELHTDNTVSNSPSFQGLPIRYYYDMNDYNSDPNNPSIIANTRLSGGRSRKRSKKYAKLSRKYKKHRGSQRGGFNIFRDSPFLTTASYNIPAAFGNIPFAYLSNDIISGSTTPQYPENPSTTEHPSETKYNYINPPLA
jgi:hypothetical protein